MMPIKHPKTARVWRVAAQISLSYALVASVWIYASDRLLAQLADCPPALTSWQTYKGWLFVGVTTVLLYGLMGSLLARALAPSLSATGLRDAAQREPITPFPSLWQDARVPLFIFSVLAGVIGGVGYLAYTHQKQALEKMTADELLAISDYKAEDIRHWLAERRSDAAVMSRDPFLAQAVRHWLSAGAPANEDGERLQAWLTHLKATAPYAAVVLLDARGQVRLGVGHTKLHPQRQALARQAMATGQVLMADLHWRQEVVGGPIDLDLMVPLGLGANAEGQPVGALILKIDPQQYLFPLLQTWPTQSSSAETLLVRREGKTVLFLNELRHRQGAALQFRLPMDRTQLPATLAIQGQSGVLAGVDYRQIPVLAAVREIAGTAWFLVTKIDANEVYAPLHTLMRWLATVVSLLIMAAGIATMLWWHQQHVGFVAESYRRELERQALAQRFAYLAKYANDSILLTDSQGQIIEANDRAVATYGYAHEELQRLNIRALHTPQTQAQATEEMAQIAHSNGLVFETIHCRRDGSCFPVEVSSRQIEIQDQTYLQSIIRDISERQRIEVALRESQAQLQTIIENLDEGLVIADLKGHLLHWNRAALAMHGFASLAECQRRLSEFADIFELAGMDGTVWPLEQWPLARILRGEHLREVEVHVRHLKADWQRVYSYGGTLVRNASGEPLLAVVTLSDITERKRAEATLRESEQRLSRAQEIAHLGSWELDLVNNVLTWSDEAYRIFGLRPQEFSATYEAFLERVHPDDRAAVDAAYTSSLRENRDTYEIEHRVVHQDTDEIRIVHEKCEHFRDATGRIIRSVGMVHDISERKRAEQALRESEAHLRAIVHAVPDVLLVLDEEGRYLEILTVQPPLLYTDPTALKGKLMRDVLPAEVTQVGLQAIRQTLLTRRPQHFEYALAIKKAGQRYFEACTAPLEAPIMGKPAVVLLARDVTQQRLTEASFRQAQKMEAVGQLTGGMAHDFNNLLAVILGNLELLAEDLDNPALANLVQRALEATERGADLIRRLLAFARKQPLQAKPVDLNQLMTGMLELLQRILGETIQVEIALAEDLAQTVIDPGQFETALLNLVVNARDAMPNGGRLTIETANRWLAEDDVHTQIYEVGPGPYVMLAVSDTGSGMPAEVAEHAFEPFFTTKAVGQGSGLGLSMVYGLVKQLGGHLQLYSELHRGTTLRMYLLAVPPTPDATLAAPPSEALLPTGQGQLILVVEDEAPVRRLAVRMLQSLGYQTVEAETAATALKLLETTPQVALLFTDVVLPSGKSGVDLAQEARRRRPDLKVLFTSGYTEAHLTRFSRHLKDSKLLSKPYRKAQLADQLHALLSNGLSIRD